MKSSYETVKCTIIIFNKDDILTASGDNFEEDIFPNFE